MKIIRDEEWVDVKDESGEHFRFELKPAIFEIEGLKYWMLPEWSGINQEFELVPLVVQGDKIVYDGYDAEVTAGFDYEETETGFVWSLSVGCRVKKSAEKGDYLGFSNFIESINGIKVLENPVTEEVKAKNMEYAKVRPCDSRHESAKDEDPDQLKLF